MRASGGGGERGGVRQGEEVRENRSDRQEVNGRCRRRRREEKDRGRRGDSRRGGERERGDMAGIKVRRGRGGRSCVERSDRLRLFWTHGESRRLKMFGSFTQFTRDRTEKHRTVRQDERTNSI